MVYIAGEDEMRKFAKTMIVAGLLSSGAATAHASEIVTKYFGDDECTGTWLFSNCDSTMLYACHPDSNEATVLHRRKYGQMGWESTLRLAVGDIFVYYDKDTWGPRLARVTKITFTMCAISYETYGQ